MKKIFLLIVSGLLIACMAGSALAQNAQVTNSAGVPYTINPITVSYDTPTVMGLHVYNIQTGERGHTYPISVEVTKDDGSGNYLVPVPLTEVTCDLKTDSLIMPLTGDLTINEVVSVTVNSNGGADSTAEYKITIFVGGDSTSSLVSASEGIRVPEFPTVALPVAGILGLLFVFGRKKEGL